MSVDLLARLETAAAADAVPAAIDKRRSTPHLLLHVPSAAQVGVAAVALPGRDVAGERQVVARANGARPVVIGASIGRGWLGRSLARFSLHVVPDPASPKADEAQAAAPPRGRVLPHLAAIAAVAVATLVGYPLVRLMSVHDVGMVLLMAVIFTARRYGLWPSVTASVLGLAVYDFFFLPPLYSFAVAQPSDVLTLAGFLVVALIVSSLTAQTRRQTTHLIERVRTISALYAFSRKAVGIGGLDELLQMTATQLAAAAGCGALVLMPGADGLAARAASPGAVPLDAAEMAAAAQCWTRDQALTAGVGGLSLLLPLRTRRGAIGVVLLRTSAVPTDALRRLADALIDQAAIAIERIRLAEDVDEAKLQAETERLRNALLTSVSHDLRTPLAYIIGALSSLRSYGDAIEPAACAELVATAQDEAERLDRQVGNLLDMTRIEAGAVQVALAPVAVDEVIGAVLTRSRTLLAGHRIDAQLPPEPPLVEAGFFLLEQVLFNLLDNAAKYSAPGTTITVAAAIGDGTASIAVSDEGAGLPPVAPDQLFAPFFRHAPAGQPGAGLGLAICRGFVAAMGGSLTAADRLDRPGAVFTVTLNLAA